MQLIAIKPGFYGGRRVRRNESFEFDENELVEKRKDGKPVIEDGKRVKVKVRMPSWAKVPAEALAAIAAEDAKSKAGDTKPVGAQRASRAKSDAGAGLV